MGIPVLRLPLLTKVCPGLGEASQVLNTAELQIIIHIAFTKSLPTMFKNPELSCLLLFLLSWNDQITTPALRKNLSHFLKEYEKGSVFSLAVGFFFFNRHT